MTMTAYTRFPGRSAAWAWLAALLLIPCSHCLAAPSPDAEGSTPPPGYWRSSKDGWFWYHDPRMDPPPEALPADKAVPQVMAAPPPLTALERDLKAHESFKLRLEQSLNAAVVNPSDPNLARFLELWAETRHKAEVFTDRAQALAVRMPWVDETSRGTRPQNAAAMRVYDQVRGQEKDELVRSLAQTHGLYFFFRGDCAYCHAFAPMLKQFETKYGFTVFPISLDGAGMPLYPRPMRDNGISAQVMQALQMPEGAMQVPFTVLAQPSTREVLPVGFGPMTAADIVERIWLLNRMRQASTEAADGNTAGNTADAAFGAVQRPRLPVGNEAAGGRADGREVVPTPPAASPTTLLPPRLRPGE
jgi:conjugal transfer pilus assembly protein TraF